MENLRQEEHAHGGTHTAIFVQRAHSFLLNALPHLFTFIEHPYLRRTTNHAEGGVNNRLKE